MRVRSCETWIAASEDVLLLIEPADYPMDYFPEADVLQTPYNAVSTCRVSMPTTEC